MISMKTTPNITNLTKETARIAIREDLRLLVKEYARQGHLQSQSGTNQEFERMWRLAFPVAKSVLAIPTVH